MSKRTLRRALAAVAIVAAGSLVVAGGALASSPVRAPDKLHDDGLDLPDLSGIASGGTGVVPGQVAQMAHKASTDTTAIYVLLDHVYAIGWQVHHCEQGDNWYADGYTSDGHFQGGMGHEASNYQKYAGHSALLDSPEQQILVAWQAHRDGVRWAATCEAFASQWP